ncbi:MAG: hypothetical protein JNM65_14620 [Verrucomicrobiaceae bacterium]|nr:hypothetical protein [Verrucomicrobiaceae bacterium]
MSFEDSLKQGALIGTFNGVLGGAASPLVLRSAGTAAKSAPRQTLIHFTDEAGHTGITGSQQLFNSTGSRHARFGDGQYFTDLTPEMIGASTKAGLTAEQVAAGQISMGQASSRLFGVPWNSGKMSHFIEIDVTGLNLVNPRPGTFLLPNNAPLDLTGRIIRSGATR